MEKQTFCYEDEKWDVEVQAGGYFPCVKAERWTRGETDDYKTVVKLRSNGYIVVESYSINHRSKMLHFVTGSVGFPARLIIDMEVLALQLS